MATLQQELDLLSDEIQNLKEDQHVDLRHFFRLALWAKTVNPTIQEMDHLLTSSLLIDSKNNVGLGNNALENNTSGANNIAIGYNSLTQNTTQGNNIAIGSNALEFNVTGTINNAVGYQALRNNTAGNFNNAFGGNALTANTEGNYNNAVGDTSLIANTTGSYNNAFGSDTLSDNTSGSGNSAFGDLALTSNQTGDCNTAMGQNALDDVTTGSANTALGWKAGTNLTTGSDNIYVGANVAANSTDEVSTIRIGTGNHNVFIPGIASHTDTTAPNVYIGNDGKLYRTTYDVEAEIAAGGGSGDATFDTTTNNASFGTDALETINLGGSGIRNIGIGRDALKLNNHVNANDNIAVGNYALAANATGGGQTVVGSYALSQNTTGTANTSVGFMTLRNNTTGGYNTALGNQALYANMSDYNTAVGYQALRNNTTGSYNTAVGFQSFQTNTTGLGNVALGHLSLQANTTGNDNIAVGGAAAYTNTTGRRNITVGRYALWNNTTGSHNIAVGYKAAGDTTPRNAHNITAIGTHAAYANTGADLIATGSDAAYSNSGQYVTAIGYNALSSNQGNRSIAIGYQAGSSITNAGTDDNIIIGNIGQSGDAHTIRIGTDGSGDGQQNKCFVAGIRGIAVTGGNSVVVDANGQLGDATASSRTVKKDIERLESNEELLQKLLALDPVAFKYINDSTNKLHYGLIAEDVASIFPEFVSYDEKENPTGIRYDELNKLLLFAFQETYARLASKDKKHSEETGMLKEELKVLQTFSQQLFHLQQEEKEKVDVLKNKLADVLVQLEKYKQLDALLNKLTPSSLERMLSALETSDPLLASERN